MFVALRRKPAWKDGVERAQMEGGREDGTSRRKASLRNPVDTCRRWAWNGYSRNMVVVIGLDVRIFSRVSSLLFS
jgi:hypothetical protein